MTMRTVLMTLFAVVCVGPAAIAQPAPAGSAAPSFARDIAPLIIDRCGSCHRPGGSAPFALLSYKDVRQRATLVAEVTRRRYMPPWKASVGDGPFVGHQPLTDAEIARIGRWVEAGAPEGEPRDLPPLPTWTDGWQLGPPDLVVSLPEAYVLPASDNDKFRIFAVPLRVDRTTYVRGIEFHPGNTTVVHHANMRIDRTASTRNLDAIDPLPGYEGLIPRSAQYPDGHFLGWTPGQIAPPVDPALAWRLDPGTDLVLELHMQPSGTAERVQPTIGFYLSDRPPTQTPSILRLGSQGIDMAAGDAAYTIADEFVLPVDVDLLAIQPHAHFRAREVVGTATLPGGEARTLIHITDWDFRWQHVFRYVTPQTLPKGTRLAMRYTYDNSAENPRNPRRPPTRVLWGQRSSDEMGDLWFQVLPRSDADRQRFNAQVLAKMTNEDIIGYETMLRGTPNDVELHDDVALLYMRQQRIDRAIDHFRTSAALKPDSAQAHYNLGTALTMGGDLTGALKEFDGALVLNPNYARARSNRADVLAGLGRHDEAVAEYLQAIALDPTLATTHNNLGSLLLARGDVDGAGPHFDEALRLSPGYAEATYGLGRIARERGRAADAVRLLKEAISLKPGWAPPLADLAWLLAASPDANVRRQGDAVRLAEQAVAATGRQDAVALDTLGVAYADAGRFADAVTAARAALQLGPDPSRAADIERRLTLFAQQQPYRQPGTTSRK